MSFDPTAHVNHGIGESAIQLLEDTLDEQIEYDTEPSHQLAQGLFDLMVSGYGNGSSLVPLGQALAIMNKCYGILNDGKELQWETVQSLLASK